MLAERIFILTGAGVSAESGLSTFRDKGGIWAQYSIEEVASIQGYERNPQKVLDFYNMRRNTHRGVEPNAAHIALGQLQTHWAARGGLVTICTQNVDNLHERGGASVIHMHGEIAQARCHECGALAPYKEDLCVSDLCRACGESGGMRPNVVWFGETPLYMDKIYEALASAELFVSIGTSGNVYPAAGFVSAARRAGIPTMEINLEASENAHAFNVGRYGKATEQVPAWVAEMVAIAG